MQRSNAAVFGYNIRISTAVIQRVVTEIVISGGTAK